MSTTCNLQFARRYEKDVKIVVGRYTEENYVFRYKNLPTWSVRATCQSRAEWAVVGTVAYFNCVREAV